MKKLIKTFPTLLFLFITSINKVFAVGTGEVENKLRQGSLAIQGVLTGLAVVVGIIAITKVVIKSLPSLDDPHVKNEMWHSVGSIFIGVAAIAAAVWIVPWIFGLFQ